MKQSIDKIANLLLARKAIHSLPANTSLTLRELNSLIIESHGNASAATIATETVASTIKPTIQQQTSIRSLSGLRSNHQAPLSILASAQLESPSSAGFQAAIRQLSSSSSSGQKQWGACDLQFWYNAEVVQENIDPIYNQHTIREFHRIRNKQNFICHLLILLYLYL